MGKAIGIDLGTTNSVMAVIKGGCPLIIPNSEGENLTPSVVAVDSFDKILVGWPAKKHALINPQNTIASIKRKMGTDYKVSLNGKIYTPQEISAMILYKMRKDAEDYLGSQVDKAVITVPAYFNDHQRQATCDAGVIAGFEVLRIINEPTSASLAYGLDKEDIHTVLIWDLGGGTFDVSILELGGSVFEVKAVNGNTSLGGDDWDLRLMEYINDQVRKKHKMDLSKDLRSWQALRENLEKTKIKLSDLQAAKACLPECLPDITITRVLFEDLTRDLLKKMINPTKQALEDAHLFPCDIDRVVLVGGATRMPAVRILAEELLGRLPYCKINPDEVVALGAALQAGLLTGEVKEMTLIDVNPLSLGIETMGGIFTKIINRNTIIPASKSQIFTTALDNQTSVDVHVLQGERSMAIDNLSLGKFTLEDIPPAQRGEPQIEVTFQIDVNGILQVSASDIHTDTEQKIKITTANKLAPEEIEKMIKQSNDYRIKDEKEKKKAEILIYAKNIQEASFDFLQKLGMCLKEKDRNYLEKKLKTLNRAVAEKDSLLAEEVGEDVRRKLKVLSDRLNKKKKERV